MATTPEQHQQNNANRAHKHQREQLAQQIAGRITRTQTHLANRLNARFGRLGKSVQQAVIIGIMLAMATYCTYLIVSNIPSSGA